MELASNSWKKWGYRSMNQFLVILNCKLTEDIRRYFESNGAKITHFYEVIPDIFFGETPLSLMEMKNLKYIHDVRVPLGQNN